MKKKINAVVVVEGKSDTQKLKNLFEVETIETNGSQISKEVLNLIIETSKKNDIILLLDPDYQGEKIRKKIEQHVSNCYHIFINKNDIKKNSKKKGVAETKNSALIAAFDNLKKFQEKTQSINLKQYQELQLSSFDKRLFLCNKLNISYCNNKQLFKRLNMLGLNYIDVLELMRDYG